MGIKLDIGCGKDVIEGCVGIDAYVQGENIVNAPMWSLPYPDNSISEIYSSHALEHVSKAMVLPTLKEWLRVLEPGGTALIAVPDLEWCCTEWLKRKTNDWYMDIIFGNQKHGGEFHLTGYTQEIMGTYLVEAGFYNEIGFTHAWSHRQRTLLFQAKKAGEPCS